MSKVAKAALDVELGTKGGKFNWSGLVLLMFFMMLLAITDGIELIVGLFNPETNYGGPDLGQLTYVWIGLFVVCCAVLFAEDCCSQKYLDNPPGGRHRKENDP